MKNRLRIVAIFGLVMFFAASAPAAIFSSNFAGASGEINPPVGFGVTNPGLFANSVWQVISHNVDYVGSSYNFQAPPSGGNMVDLNGFSCSIGTQNCANGSALGEIRTASPITFTAGNTYQLTFYYSGNPEYMNDPLLSSAQKTLIAGNQWATAGFTNAGNTQTFANLDFQFTSAMQSGQTATGSAMNWQLGTLTFVAPTTSMYLFFSSNPNLMNLSGYDYDLQSWGVVVAGVTLNDLGNENGQVPEPASFALLGAGLVALAAFRRRN